MVLKYAKGKTCYRSSHKISNHLLYVLNQESLIMAISHAKQTKHKCANCKGYYFATSKSCPTWVQEEEVQRLKATNGISFIP